MFAEAPATVIVHSSSHLQPAAARYPPKNTPMRSLPLLLESLLTSPDHTPVSGLELNRRQRRAPAPSS